MGAEAFDDEEMADGFFADVGGLGNDLHFFSRFFGGFHIILDGHVVGEDIALGHGQVFFMDGFGFELVFDGLKCQLGFADDHEALGVFV